MHSNLNDLMEKNKENNIWVDINPNKSIFLSIVPATLYIEIYI